MSVTPTPSAQQAQDRDLAAWQEAKRSRPLDSGELVSMTPEPYIAQLHDMGRYDDSGVHPLGGELVAYLDKSLARQKRNIQSLRPRLARDYPLGARILDLTWFGGDANNDPYSVAAAALILDMPVPDVRRHRDNAMQLLVIWAQQMEQTHAGTTTTRDSRRVGGRPRQATRVA